MARPPRTDVDYFPHEVNHGRKMHIIEAKYGNDGYAVWFKLLEQLGKASHHYIDVREDENYMYLESIFKTDKADLILNDLAKIGAINKELWEQRIIWSDKFIDSIQDAYAKRNNKCLTLEGLRSHLLGLGVKKPTRSGVNSGDKPQRIEKNSKEKNSSNQLFVNAYPSKHLFCEAMSSRAEGRYSEYDLEHYYDKVLNWSDSKKVMRKDWLAQAGNFILGDEQRGQAVKPKTTNQVSN